MEREVDNRWINLPVVEVEFGGIMTVNRKYVSLPDITSETLADYIHVGKPLLDYELERSANRQKFYDRPGRRPVILLGKLAIAGEEPRVFATPDQLLENREFDIDDFKDSFKGYWEEVMNQGYTPIIESNLAIGSPKLAGTWLGLRKPVSETKETPARD